MVADRFLKTVVALKEATAVASSAPTCNLVCMPPPPYVEKVAHWVQTSRVPCTSLPTAPPTSEDSAFSLQVVVSASDALSMTNPDKLKAFFFRGAASLASGEKQQYAGVLAETIKFSFSVDKSQLGKFKDDGYALLLAIDNAASSAPPKKMPTAKPLPKNAAVEQVALELADGLYPIVQGLQAKPVAALAGKVISLAASGDPKEISAPRCSQLAPLTLVWKPRHCALVLASSPAGSQNDRRGAGRLPVCAYRELLLGGSGAEVRHHGGCGS